ncbi:MAG: FtsX-like permease family protein, partial [Chloroflexi bacterium]|nr:FtsX-like permease family protein [Chloroflexota bacterium]
MTTWTLIRRSLSFHARAHFGALLGAAVGSAVLVGALVVGDSVRESLRQMALVRLGIIDYAIHTGDRFFLASLDQRLLANAKRSGVPIDRTTPRYTYRDDSIWKKSSATALLLSGVAARQDGSARANRVNVLGVEAPAWPRFANWAALSKGFSRRLADGRTNHIDEVLAMQIGKAEAILTRWRQGEIVLVNETLARQLAVREGDEVILRVRKPTALAQDAVIASRDEVSVALRLKVGPVLSANLLGDFSLTANQIPPANAFLPLEFLGTKLAIPGRVNLLVQGPLKAKPRFSWLDMQREKLGQWIRKWWIKGWRSAQRPTTVPSSTYRIIPRPSYDSVIGPKLVAEPTPQEAQEFLDAELQKVWSLEDAELSVRALEQPQAATGGEYLRPFVELTSSRIFLEQAVVTAALTPRSRVLADRQDFPADAPNDVAFSRLVTNGVPVLTYLVNLIQAGGRATPYSMVTAAGGGYVPAGMRDDEILVNEWLAEDLRVKPGDLVRLTYYLADSGSKLIERTNSFRVRAVVPIKGRYADRTLMPEFPGLAKAESTHDWEAGFPLVHEIREQDEAYWKQYRGTPKAFITLAAGQTMWASRFGALTAIRYEVPANSFASTYRDAVYRNVLANLDPAAVGLHFDPVREQALKAATQSQDFGGLFLGFSFFLIVAALLLMALLFQFGIEQRATEVGTLLALGFTPRQVRRLLLGEGGGLALLGGLIGVAGGVWYAQAMLHGLSTIWRSAVGTSALQYHAR